MTYNRRGAAFLICVDKTEGVVTMNKNDRRSHLTSRDKLVTKVLLNLLEKQAILERLAILQHKDHPDRRVNCRTKLNRKGDWHDNSP